LASISMDTDDPEQRHRYTVQAQNWLDLGSSRPEAERERLRWARFEIKSVSSPSGARGLHEGHRARVEPSADAGRPAPALLSADASVAGGGTIPEVRSLALDASGDLTVHGIRTQQTVGLRVDAYYPGPATPGMRPERIVIRTRRPFVVPLDVHDIK